MNKRQQKAIDRVNAALKELHKADITLCGLDTDILYATKKALTQLGFVEGKTSHGKNSDVAEYSNSIHADVDECGKLYSEGYDDSGGS